MGPQRVGRGYKGTVHVACGYLNDQARAEELWGWKLTNMP